MSTSKPSARAQRERAVNEMYAAMERDVAAARARIFDSYFQRSAELNPRGSIWTFVEKFNGTWTARDPNSNICRVGSAQVADQRSAFAASLSISVAL